MYLFKGSLGCLNWTLDWMPDWMLDWVRLRTAAATATTGTTSDSPPNPALVSASSNCTNTIVIRAGAIIDYQNDVAKSFWNRSIYLAQLILEPYRLK